MEPSAISPRPILGPVVTLIKRLIRKQVRWYIAPQIQELTQRLNDFQQVQATWGAYLDGRQRTLDHQMDVLKLRLHTLQQKVTEVVQGTANQRTTLVGDLESRAGAMQGEMRQMEAQMEMVRAALQDQMLLLQDQMLLLQERLQDFENQQVACQASALSRQACRDGTNPHEDQLGVAA